MSNLQMEYAGIAWNLVLSYGGIDFRNELNGLRMNRLENGLTLARDLHGAFDQLDLWFEAVPVSTATLREVTKNPDFSELL